MADHESPVTNHEPHCAPLCEPESQIGRLGVLGGTFDPPHYGHLLLADTARVQLRLDRVLFVPAGQPPHKLENQPSPVAHRMALVEALLADAGEPAFCLSRVDMDRSGPHYTVGALAVLREAYPTAQVWFLIGSDSLADLPRWRDPVGIITLARLAVLARPRSMPDLDELSETVPGLRRCVDWLNGPSLDLSSSALRERVCQGLPLRYLTTPSVEAYVRRHGLYDARGTRRAQ